MTEENQFNDEKAMDIAYEIFLELASEELSEENIELFNQQFADHGATEVVETAENWDEEIGVLIDPEAYAEIWIGVLNETEDEMTHVFAKVLLSYEDDEDFHIIWG